jgi:hypothetical protein
LSTLPSFRSALPLRTLHWALAAALIAAFPALAQNSRVFPTEALLVLPDSPGTIISTSAPDTDAPASSSLGADAEEGTITPGHSPHFEAAFQSTPAGVGVMAGHLDKYIEPGQRVPQLRVGDKILLGFRDAASPLSAVGWIVTAGWAQLVNGSPNYGTNRIAFAQRFGAAAARDSSEGIFTDSIMAPVFHEDPRYYKMGPGHNFIKRAAYAATRPLITRTDGGHTTINLAFLSGNLAGSALTQAYYPPVNRGFSQVLQTFGGSIGGGALGFVASEFLGDILHVFHKKS